MHMALITVLDYALFWYWYAWANRYTVLNFHEAGFLPGRYILSGLVAGAIVYWVYLLPVTLLKTFWRGYWHPRWWLLWLATASVSSIQVMLLVRGGSPPLTLEVALVLVVHLQAVHLIMVMVGERAIHKSRGAIIPGVRSTVIFIFLWLFWLWYSFEWQSSALPRPAVGADWERAVLGACLGLALGVALAFRLGLRLPNLGWEDVVIPAFKITLSDLLDGFYSAWALYYIIVPVVHYLLRGYVMSYSGIFPTSLPQAGVILLWSAIGMWVIIAISKTDFKLRLPHIHWGIS